MIVTLKGILAVEYGAKHEFFRVESPADIVNAFEANFPGFKARINQLKRWGYRLTTPSNHVGLSEKQVFEAVSDREIVIRPVVLGSGAVGKILLGAALIAVAFAVPFAAAGGGTQLGLLGAGLLLNGFSEILAPRPRSSEESERSSSFQISRGQSRDDTPIPLWIGYFRVGGMPVLSFNSYAEDF